jgi:uncharacterized protein YndB with AHSA1/START domain
MEGKRQIERNVIVDASPGAVWAVLADSRLLPRWAPIVDEVTACAAGGEAVGEVRHCTARLAGRQGRMVERCVELVARRRIAYVVDEESFGMRRMFDHYGFALELEPGPAGGTRVTLQTHYSPRNALYAVINAAVMRRRFAAVCEDLLAGLKSFMESGRPSAPAAPPSTA